MKKRTVSDEAIAEAFAKRCHKCRYRGAESKTQCCDYILHTGHMRGCSVSDCDKFVRGDRMKVGEPPNSPIQRKRRKIRKHAGRKTAEHEKVKPEPKPNRKRLRGRKKEAVTKIGELIDAYCDTHEISAADFAKSIYTHFSSVSNWRRGYNLPGESAMVRMSEVMGISVDEIKAAVNADHGAKAKL